MTEGIRVTASFDDPGICPVVDLSTQARIVHGSVSTSVCGDECSRSVTEFSVTGTDDPASHPDVELLFSSHGIHRYRFTHSGIGCPCECLGAFGCPVERYLPDDGTLELVFYAASYDQLQDVMAELQDRFPGMDVQRFIRSPGEQRHRDEVVFDRSELTDRQREALSLALERGYFDRPRGANASELAEELDISPSTYLEHLNAAQRKIFEVFI